HLVLASPGSGFAFLALPAMRMKFSAVCPTGQIAISWLNNLCTGKAKNLKFWGKWQFSEAEIFTFVGAQGR
ncbi:MAG: hypothetical protein KDD28_19285, partial [Phaeodactylibacter sp.]|nr:hypothetical protein [Phaeodactylibacter sp.]